jgi:hypothetical protein
VVVRIYTVCFKIGAAEAAEGLMICYWGGENIQIEGESNKSVGNLNKGSERKETLNGRKAFYG